MSNLQELFDQYAAKLTDPDQKRQYIAASRSFTGRPTKYDPDFCPLMLFYYAQGYTVCSVCCELGISKSTYYQWLSDKADASKDAFRTAHKKGRTLSRNYLEGVALDSIKSGKADQGRFLFIESRLRREFNAPEHCAKVDFASCETNEDRVKELFGAISRGELSAADASTLMSALKVSDELLHLPGLIDDLDSLKEKLKSIGE
tara:strand:- start:425 stop:1033 length:609 start_codon:yes stop_codon:yes gene_type:complete